MLVISRKPDESIVVGENLVVTVLQISAGRVRLGLNAPADVVIRRSELVLARHEAAASKVDGPGKFTAADICGSANPQNA